METARCAPDTFPFLLAASLVFWALLALFFFRVVLRLRNVEQKLLLSSSHDTGDETRADSV